MKDRTDLILPLGAEINALLAAFRRLMTDSATCFHPDLQPATYQIAVMLSARGPSKAGRIAEQLGMDKSSVSRLVKTLCDHGLAFAAADLGDGRAKVYHLTAAGAEGVRQANAVKSEAFYARLEGWSDDELAEFTRLLRRFNTA